MTSEARVRAVIFDLWDTLVDWPLEAWNASAIGGIGGALPRLTSVVISSARFAEVYDNQPRRTCAVWAAGWKTGPPRMSGPI